MARLNSPIGPVARRGNQRETLWPRFMLLVRHCCHGLAGMTIRGQTPHVLEAPDRQQADATRVNVMYACVYVKCVD